MRTRTPLIVAFAVLAATILACSSGTTSGAGTTAATTPPPTTVPAGQALNLDVDLLGSHQRATITLSNVRYNVKPTNQFDKPQRGQFIVADISATVLEGKMSITSASFKLVAADGTAYNTTSMVGVTEVSAYDLAPGQKTAGSIVFDAAKGAEKGAKIALTDLFASGDAGYWTL